MSRKPPILWRPGDAFVRATRLHEYMTWLAAHGGPRSKTYEELWRWSVGDFASSRELAT